MKVALRHVFPQRQRTNAAGEGGPDRGKFKLKFPGFGRRPPSSRAAVVEDPPPQEVVLDFEENLAQNHLAEATNQLISREELLFSRGSDEAEGPPSNEEENQLQSDRNEEENQLQSDHEKLLFRLWMAVHDTFSSTPSSREHLATLRSAVASVAQQEEQDRLWEEQPEDVAKPDWRPLQCRRTHDALLRKMVDSRLRKAPVDEVINREDNLSSDTKREVCKMGKRLKEDLLMVVRDVKDCYPPEFDICNLYAGIYHQTFCARLTELAHAGVDIDHCSYLLFWINDYYPNDILKNDLFEGHIQTASMGPLMSEADLTALEDQYLTHKEEKVRTWFSSILRREQEIWLKGRRPELEDGYCFCPLAIDVIEVLDSTVKEARSVLSSEEKAQRILCQLDRFLISYKSSLDDLSNARQQNTQAVLKANLVSVEQFRDLLEGRNGLTSDWIRTRCRPALTALRDSAYAHLTCPTHLDLKVHYRRLWTPAWLTGSQTILDDIQGLLDGRLHSFRDLKPLCMEELVGRLHTEVVVEYVRRMMKRRVRMRSRQQQEAVSQLLRDDNKTLSCFFSAWGSKESWLTEVLTRLAEVLKLQDPGSIQLEVVTLARDYPDLSSLHVSALLSFKASLSAAETRAIKKSLEENRPSITQTNTRPPFFSKVPVK